jgi:phage FluMu protein Com
METNVKCRKCGRVLKKPASIAMGMGPKCAGVSITAGKKLHAGNRRQAGKTYNAVGISHSQIPLVFSKIPENQSSMRAMARRQREERRRLFQERRAFQCGKSAQAKTPLVYEPVGEKEWKDSLSGKVLSQEQLQAHLRRSRLI